MKILFLSRWFPYPPDNGARLRVFHLLLALAQRHDVSLVSFASEPVTEAQRAALARQCACVLDVPYRPFNPASTSSMAGLFSPVPRSVVDTFSQPMAQAVRDELGRFSPDFVIASQIDMAPYARCARAPLRILEELELARLKDAATRETRPLKRVRYGLTWAKMKRYVTRSLSDFDGCTVVSEPERRLAQTIAPDHTPIAVIPNGVDVSDCAAFNSAPEPNSMIYSGSLTYDANLDAVQHFTESILPLVQAELPDAVLRVTGRFDGVPVETIASRKGLMLTGHLPDVRPAVARSWISVVPLRFGGGTRLKILESLALGTPVISTHKGAEGLELVDGRDILLADTPQEFAFQVVRVLKDAGLRLSLSRNGREAVKKRYDWTSIGESFCAFIESMVAAAPVVDRAKAM